MFLMLTSAMGVSAEAALAPIQSVRWRMLCECAQEPAQVHHAVTIQIEPVDRGTARRCEPDHQREVFIPIEVLTPDVAARVVERDGCAADGIHRLRAGILVAVAPVAGEREVGELARAAAGDRED